MYRPQFAYPTPPGCRDEDFVYYFDGSNTPMLNKDISAGLVIEHIPLVLQQDAPFYWRGVKVDLRPGSGSGPTQPNISIRFRDCYQNDLMDNYIPATQWGFAMNPVKFNNGDYQGPPVPLESEVYCPRGGVLEFFINSPVLANPSYVFVSLFGVKRFKECSA